MRAVLRDGPFFVTPGDTGVPACHPEPAEGARRSYGHELVRVAMVNAPSSRDVSTSGLVAPSLNMTDTEQSCIVNCSVTPSEVEGSRRSDRREPVRTAGKWSGGKANGRLSEDNRQCTIIVRRLLCGRDRLAGANACAGAAVDALVSVDNIDVASRDSLYRALADAGTAGNTSVRNFVSHSFNF